MTGYLALRFFHIGCAVLSASGFMLRGYWMLTDSPALHNKLTRVLPHLIDTLLLLSAIALVIMSGFYPLTTSWINIKIILLLFYIMLGTVALKRGRTRPIRITALILALLSVVGIFVTAIVKP